MTEPERDPGLVYACITHVPLWLEPPEWVMTIRLGQAQRPGGLNLRTLAPEWEPYHPVLGGTAGAFALKNYLRRQRPDATRVGVCQYRKFVSGKRMGGTRDPKYRSMDAIHKSALQNGHLAEALWPGDAQFLISAPLRFTRLPWYRRGYLKEYGRDHHVEDFLRFTAEAVELGVLDHREVLSFFREDVFVPGGVELGVYPAAFWLESIEAIEHVVRACVNKYPGVRPGYQARNWAFCAERLGSWLLLKRLRAEVSGVGRHVEWIGRQEWIRRHVGQLHLIVEDDHTGYRGGV